ncbi:hypothetical protein GGS23DRAFT_194675 [Durotheca rogersii]|uniref:uncharacterized protein n=1 Tax=Durotheca rogersii TaxID=419775 RepID=UPI00221E4B2D|nr:uncharacterized protein GGS23DRAFT_194675 [Durotheca rogersii]KAI5867771.1 hypothetical protein GGS23DRAFT_194675 [Durotheca rogersii]
MSPVLTPRSSLRARGDQMSPGAIAGTVIGCVFGGSLLLIVVGFLYFRYRRISREARAKTGILPTAKTFVNQHRTSPFALPGFLSRQTPAATLPGGHPSSTKETTGSDRVAPDFENGLGSQQLPARIYGSDFARDHEAYYLQPNFGQPTLPPDIDFSLPPQPTAFSNTDGPGTNLPFDHASPPTAAANSSYYDTRISMGSAPEQAPMPPSGQMTELYEAQLKDSRERRKRSGSLTSRIWSSIKRKRSTHSSAHDNNSPLRTGSQQFFPASPVQSPVGAKQESSLELTGGADAQASARTQRFFEEPGEMSESTGVLGAAVGKSWSEKDRQHDNYKRQRRDDSLYESFPLRTSSSIRETTERDPELPSAVLRSPDSTDGLPHLAQPQSEARPQGRLMSPDIPEPMELDGTFEDPHRPSVFQGSHSPPLQPEAFVSPMSIMQPSNAAEKAAYTDYQMENSTSPPLFSTSPPRITPHPLASELPDTSAQDDLDDFDADSFLDIPSDDEPRGSSDSYYYTTTPGQSSTEPSMGRTPDTRVTVSPSPYPVAHDRTKAEPESSSSPEGSRLSPQSPGHICEECGRYFDQIHKLNHHKRYHDRKHECPYEGCDKRFGTKTHLDRHINDKHVKSKAYHCIEPTCPYFKGGKAFPRKDNWRRHMVKKHGATANDLEALDEVMGL